MKTHRIIFLAFAILATVSASRAQQPAYSRMDSVPPGWIESVSSSGNQTSSNNTRVCTSCTDIEYEPTIAVNPSDNRILIMSIGEAPTANSEFGYVGFYHSTDGGYSWAGSEQLPGLSSPGASDATVSFGSNAAFYSYLEQFNIGDVWYWALRIRKSTDGGATWPSSSTIDIPNYGNPDRDHMVADGTNVYVAWTDMNTVGSTGAPVKFAYSNNSGTSYTTYGSISGSTVPTHTNAKGQGVNLAAGLNGYV